MIPWPEKCNICACRRCERVLKCDLLPCDACKDKPYTKELCPVEGKGASPKEVMEAFNRICKSLPPIKGLTENRRKKIRTRNAPLEEFEAVFAAAEKSDFLSGRTGVWQAHFDWLMEPRNWQKVIEGAYPNQGPTKQKVRDSVDYPQHKYSDADIAHIFENLDGDDQ